MLAVLETGPAKMQALYRGVEASMSGRTLSPNGKAAIRSYINRTCQQRGLVQAETRARQEALWHITPKGLLLLHPNVPIPKARIFASPLLRALGALTDHSLSALPRTKVMPEVLRLAGYDPANLPANWEVQSSNKQTKIHETLRWVARSMDTLITSPGRGQWALTPAGLDKAALLNGVTLAPDAKVVSPASKSTTPNATSKWFTKNLRPGPGGTESALMSSMRKAVRRNLPLSDKRDIIDDHIHTFILRAVRRDSFAKRLAEGQTIPYSKVAAYCVNSGRSDARDMGTEPICREMMGARTDTERKALSQQDQNTRNRSTRNLNRVIQIPTKSPSFMTESLADERDLEAGLKFESLWGEVVERVQKCKPGAWERYANLLLLKAQGYTTAEIARKEDVSCHRAAKMLAQARAMVRSDEIRVN